MADLTAAAPVRIMRLLGKSVAGLLSGIIRGYQLFISPVFPAACRFHPTCSAYAREALKLHGPIRGSWLALWRILRCNPWGGAGDDPVPPPRHSPRSGKSH